MRGRERETKAIISIQVKNEHLVKVGIRVGSLGLQKFNSNSSKTCDSYDQTSRWIEVKLVLGISEM